MLENPLVIKRPKIIQSLEEQRAARKKEHDEAEAKRVARREHALKNLQTLVKEHPGFAASLVRLDFGTFDDSEAMYDYLKKNYGKESIEAADAQLEATDYPGHPVIDKWVRLLKMADNSTLEIKPTDEIYPLL